MRHTFTVTRPMKSAMTLMMLVAIILASAFVVEMCDVHGDAVYVDARVHDTGPPGYIVFDRLPMYDVADFICVTPISSVVVIVPEAIDDVYTTNFAYYTDPIIGVSDKSAVYYERNISGLDAGYGDDTSADEHLYAKAIRISDYEDATIGYGYGLRA